MRADPVRHRRHGLAGGHARAADHVERLPTPGPRPQPPGAGLPLHHRPPTGGRRAVGGGGRPRPSARQERPRAQRRCPNLSSRRSARSLGRQRVTCLTPLRYYYDMSPADIRRRTGDVTGQLRQDGRHLQRGLTRAVPVTMAWQSWGRSGGANGATVTALRRARLTHERPRGHLSSGGASSTGSTNTPWLVAQHRAGVRWTSVTGRRTRAARPPPTGAPRPTWSAPAARSTCRQPTSWSPHLQVAAAAPRGPIRVAAHRRPAPRSPG